MLCEGYLVVVIERIDQGEQQQPGDTQRQTAHRHLPSEYAPVLIGFFRFVEAERAADQDGHGDARGQHRHPNIGPERGIQIGVDHEICRRGGDESQRGGKAKAPGDMRDFLPTVAAAGRYSGCYV